MDVGVYPEAINGGYLFHHYMFLLTNVMMTAIFLHYSTMIRYAKFSCIGHNIDIGVYPEAMNGGYLFHHYTFIYERYNYNDGYIPSLFDNDNKIPYFNDIIFHRDSQNFL